MFSVFSFLFTALVLLIMSSVKIINEYERAVIFRLGNLIGAKGPGIIIVIPVIDKMVRVDTRIETLDVRPQDIITRDNVTIKVNAVVYFRVLDPAKAVNEATNYLLATSELSQTTLRSVVGQVELDTLLSEREAVNHRLADILDQQTEPWGVKVSNVEVKQVDLPVEMQRAMAKQAEAERERRAKVIAAEGELQASEKLGAAAAVMEKNPISVQLRYLQTLAEMSNENTTNTIIPFPMELFKGLMPKEYFNVVKAEPKDV